MAINVPEVLPTMPLLEADVLSELDDYGIWDITSTEPLIGIKGIIKEAALFVSTHYDFKGSKYDPAQLYAFPRKDINDTYNYELPECVKAAQMAVIIETLRPCEETGIKQLGIVRGSKRIGDYLYESEFSTNPFMLKMNAILEPVLNNNGLNEFLIEDQI